MHTEPETHPESMVLSQGRSFSQFFVLEGSLSSQKHRQIEQFVESKARQKDGILLRSWDRPTQVRRQQRDILGLISVEEVFMHVYEADRIAVGVRGPFPLSSLSRLDVPFRAFLPMILLKAHKRESKPQCRRCRKKARLFRGCRSLTGVLGQQRKWSLSP